MERLTFTTDYDDGSDAGEVTLHGEDAMKVESLVSYGIAKNLNEAYWMCVDMGEFPEGGR